MSPNPIVNLLQPAANPLAGIFNSLKNANNPIAMLQSIAMSDPRIQTAVDLINQNGVNAKEAFFTEAQNRGVDPAPIIQQAQSMMK